jgi:50S ribosomal subunit-associated GTPase HflX
MLMTFHQSVASSASRFQVQLAHLSYARKRSRDVWKKQSAKKSFNKLYKNVREMLLEL